MSTAGEMELLGLLLCRRQKEGGGRWLKRGEVLKSECGRRWQERAGEEGEEESDRNKEGQNQHEGPPGPLLGTLGFPVTQWARYPGFRGALLVGWSPVRLGPMGMQLVGAPAG